MARPRRSLRWRLALTYAGIALLTALLIGGLLVALLALSFARADADNLGAVGERATMLPVGSPDLMRDVAALAYTSNARIEVRAPDGRVLADSGSPWLIDPTAAGRPTGVAPPSPQEIRSAAVWTGPGPAGTQIRVTEGPAAGRGVIGEVVPAGALASLAAVLAAVAVGVVVSTRIARPLDRLAAASDRMSEGDLSVRADVKGTDEIARLSVSFNTMAERVQATVEALRRFVSDAAHQWGTPLTSLRSDLELLLESAVTDDQRRVLERALSQTQRIEDLGAGLLTLSRLDAAPKRPPPVAVALLPLLTAACDAFAVRAEHAGVRLRLEPPAPDLRAASDSSRLAAAVDNLLDNAVKFTPHGGHVDVGADVDGAFAVLWVQDDGPGIPPEDRDRVFERFYRSRAVARTPGTGLGLPIAAALVAVDGGTLRLAPVSAGTDPAVGTRMEMRVPLAGPSAE